MTYEVEIPDATGDPGGYVASLLRTLGGQDPLAVLDETVDKVRELTRGLTSEELEFHPAGEWSVQENVGHLFDVDVCYGFRIRLILTESKPIYPAYDEKRLAVLPKPPFDELLDAWDGLRRANVLLYSSMDDEQRDRRGIHPEQGEEPAFRLAEKMAGHDLAHLNQISRTVEAAHQA